MSLYALADGAAAAAIRGPGGQQPQGLLMGINPAAGAPTGVVSQATQALGALAAFVPTEIVAMYVAVVPLLGSLASLAQPEARSVALQWWYIICLGLTVFFYYVMFINQYRTANNSYPSVKDIFSKYTTWRACAAVIAYIVWALAVQSDSAKLILCWHFPVCLPESGIWMGIIIFIISPLLSALDGLFQP